MNATYKEEMITDADMAKIDRLAALLETPGLDDLVANLKDAADINMNQRQAWVHFGDSDGDNIMLNQVKLIENAVLVLRRCVEKTWLTRIQAEREAAV